MQNQTISEFVKIMERGLMVIPQRIRKKAGITKGSYVKIWYKGEEIILKPLRGDELQGATDVKGIAIEKAKQSKEKGLKILLEARAARWTKRDDQWLFTFFRRLAQLYETMDTTELSIQGRFALSLAVCDGIEAITKNQGLLNADAVTIGMGMKVLLNL